MNISNNVKTLLGALVTACAVGSAQAAIEAGRPILTKVIHDFALTCRDNHKGDNAAAEAEYNAAIKELYTFLATPDGAEWAKANHVTLEASSRKDFAYKLPQPFLNAVSVCRGALKRGVLKASYSQTADAKSKAARHETARERVKVARDEQRPIEERTKATIGLQRLRFNTALATIREAFTKETGLVAKEAMTVQVEALAATILGKTDKTTASVTVPLPVATADSTKPEKVAKKKTA